MSHKKERAEKICLNCGTHLSGRFCPNCGQENIEPEDSVWHLVTEYFSDLFHFDGKLLKTARPLLLKPGFLTQEYIAGRRAAYLHPIKMYVFLSAMFFLAIFSATHIGSDEKKEKKPATKQEMLKELASQIQDLREDSADWAKEKDYVGNKVMLAQSRKIQERQQDIARLNNDSTLLGYLQYKYSDDHVTTDSSREVISLGSLTSDTATHKRNWITRMLHNKLHYVNTHIKEKEFQEKLVETIKHYTPLMMFLSLPFMAAFLKLIYIRRRNYYYVGHLLFMMHVYCASFFLLLIAVLFNKLGDYFWGRLFSFLNILITLYVFYYLYKAMRTFYKQGRGITILKYLLTGFVFTLVVFFLFLLLVTSSALMV